MKPWMRTLLFAGIGAVAGLLYYRFFGCTNGCPLTSNRGFLVVYMALLFSLFSSAIPDKKQK